METKLEGIFNYLQFVAYTLDVAKQKSYRTSHHSGKSKPI